MANHLYVISMEYYIYLILLSKIHLNDQLNRQLIVAIYLMRSGVGVLQRFSNCIKYHK